MQLVVEPQIDAAHQSPPFPSYETEPPSELQREFQLQYHNHRPQCQ